VVAFRSSSLHEWSPLDKHRLWLLMSSALVPLFSCLFGMLLLAIEPVPISIWRWSNGCSFLFAVVFVLLGRRRQSEIRPILTKELGDLPLFLYIIASLRTLLSLSQAYNALISGVFGYFMPLSCSN
jgi:Na+-translocating ferredoxin:NAD+ oxidoreductase RnfE subunit